jgi:hypothetical protein
MVNVRGIEIGKVRATRELFEARRSAYNFGSIPPAMKVSNFRRGIWFRRC